MRNDGEQSPQAYTSVWAIGAAASVLAIVPANAQQLIPLWTGFYAGAHAGLVQAGSTFIDGANPTYFGFPPLNYNASGSGLLGGIQLGYNVQTGSVVFGAEADLSGMSVSSSFTRPALGIGGIGTYTSRLNATATARLRGGVAFGNALIFVTGGVALGNIQNSVTNGLPAGTFSKTDWRAGWVFGGGIDYALSPVWSVRAEVLHMQFDRASGSASAFPTYRFAFRDQATLFRTGFNFRF